MSRPYFNFYPDAWRNDVALRSVSPTARAVWIDLLGLMVQGVPYGHLTDANGAALHAASLAALCTVDVRTFKKALNALEKAGVSSRTEAGILYSRRMVRDEKNRLARGAGGYKSLYNPNVPRSRKGYLPEAPKDTLKDIPIAKAKANIAAAAELRSRAAASAAENSPPPPQIPEPVHTPAVVHVPAPRDSLRSAEVVAACRLMTDRLGPLDGVMTTTILANLEDAPAEFLADRVRQRGPNSNSLGILPLLAKDARALWEQERVQKRKPPKAELDKPWEPDWFENEDERRAWHEKRRQIQEKRAGVAWYAR